MDRLYWAAVATAVTASMWREKLVVAVAYRGKGLVAARQQLLVEHEKNFFFLFCVREKVEAAFLFFCQSVFPTTSGEKAAASFFLPSDSLASSIYPSWESTTVFFTPSFCQSSKHQLSKFSVPQLYFFVLLPAI